MSVPYELMWDFDGACAPPEGATQAAWRGQKTFTLGCFQWVRRGRDGKGNGLKRGRVRHRVKGLVYNPQPAYDQARAFCAEKNAALFHEEGKTK